MASGSRRAVTTARTELSGVGRLFGVDLSARARLRLQRFHLARPVPGRSLALPSVGLDGDSTAALMSPDPIRVVSGANSRDAKHACLQPQRPTSVLYRGEQTVDVRTFALLAVQLLAVSCRMRTIPAMQHEPVPFPAQNRVDRLLRILFYAHHNTAVSIVVFNAILIVLVATTVGIGMLIALLLSLI